MYMEGFRQIRLLEKLGDGWGWVDGWSVFVNIKDWQGQSILKHFKARSQLQSTLSLLLG